MTCRVGSVPKSSVRWYSVEGRRELLNHTLVEAGGSHLMLLYDIKKAHRRIPVLQEEWGRQACQVRGSAVSSALTSALVRLSTIAAARLVTRRAIGNAIYQHYQRQRREMEQESLLNTITAVITPPLPLKEQQLQDKKYELPPVICRRCDVM